MRRGGHRRSGGCLARRTFSACIPAPTLRCRRRWAGQRGRWHRPDGRLPGALHAWPRGCGRPDGLPRPCGSGCRLHPSHTTTRTFFRMSRCREARRRRGQCDGCCAPPGQCAGGCAHPSGTSNRCPAAPGAAACAGRTGDTWQSAGNRWPPGWDCCHRAAGSGHSGGRTWRRGRCHCRNARPVRPGRHGCRSHGGRAWVRRCRGPCRAHRGDRPVWRGRRGRRAARPIVC